MFRRSGVGKTLSYIFLIVSSFVMIYPILYMALGAFATNEAFFNAPFLPLPNDFNLARILRAWNNMQHAYLVTLLRVAFYVFMTLAIGLIAGYIFSKMRFPGRERVFLLLLSGMVMPAILMIVPQFIFMARFPLAGGNNWLGQDGHGFFNDWPVLFMYGWVQPFAIFLLKQNFDMLPTDYEDAAKLDGAGMFTIIFRVYGPMLTPALAALTIVTFLSVWNDFLWPSLTIRSNPAWFPITFQLGTLGNRSMEASPGAFMNFMMVMWPPALVYFLLQRYFVQGLVASGIRG